MILLAVLIGWRCAAGDYGREQSAAGDNQVRCCAHGTGTKEHLRADAVMQCHAMARTIERLRQPRSLIGSTDALQRFDAWRAPEAR